MEIEHNINQHEFFYRSSANADDPAIAVLKYSLDAEQHSVDFYSTFVPPEFRGKGVAEKLVRAGLAWAVHENYSIAASCWYVAKFLK